MAYASAPPSLSGRISVSFVSKEVSDLLLWRDIKTSGAVFGGVTLGKLALWYSGASLLSVLLYGLVAAVVGSVLWAQAGGLISSHGPPLPALLRSGVSEEQARHAVAVARPVLNQALAKAGELLSGSDVILSLKVAGALFIAARVFSVVSPATLLYTVFVLAFTVPIAYELKKSDVDSLITQARQQANVAYARFHDAVLSKIPKAPKPVAKAE